MRSLSLGIREHGSGLVPDLEGHCNTSTYIFCLKKVEKGK